MGFEVHPLIIIWGAILLLVFIVSLFKYLGRRSQYRLLEKLAEKGQSLSPELLANIAHGGNGRPPEDKNPITSGIFLMCIGIALAVFFWAFEGGGMPFSHDNWFIVIGIFPFMVGLARLLGAAFGKRESK
jgi:hypothetical protein